MPCHTPEPTEEEERAYHYKDFKHNSELAEMLCELMARIEKVEGFETHVSPKILEWWEEHKERDRARLVNQFSKIFGEEHAQEAAKLSDYEKELLGFK